MLYQANAGQDQVTATQPDKPAEVKKPPARPQAALQVGNRITVTLYHTWNMFFSVWLGAVSVIVSAMTLGFIFSPSVEGTR